MTNQRPPIVSSIAASLKQSLAPDADEVAIIKRKHRDNLGTLIEEYMRGVSAGVVDGIRNAKDLVDVIKMDLLLIGEATERRDENIINQIKSQRLAEAIDLDDPDTQTMIDKMMQTYNAVNDEADLNTTVRRPTMDDVVDEGEGQ